MCRCVECHEWQRNLQHLISLHLWQTPSEANWNMALLCLQSSRQTPKTHKPIQILPHSHYILLTLSLFLSSIPSPLISFPPTPPYPPPAFLLILLTLDLSLPFSSLSLFYWSCFSGKPRLINKMITLVGATVILLDGNSRWFVQVDDQIHDDLYSGAWRKERDQDEHSCSWLEQLHR